MTASGSAIPPTSPQPVPVQAVVLTAARVHLSLRVQPPRLAAMVDFYTTLFDAPPRKRHLDYVQFDLVEPALNLTFTPTVQARTGELDHLGVQVPSGTALAAARARLVAAGFSPRDEVEVECCHSRQDKFWLTDPEGRQVEVFHRLADIERHGRAAAAADGTMTGAATGTVPGTATASGAATGCCAGESCGA
jgi:hypothetical protein